MMEILFCVLTPEASLFPQVTQTIPTMMDASEELEVLLAREKNLYTTLDYQARMQMKSLAVAQASDSVATNQTECSPPRSKKTKSTSSTEEKARDDSGRSEKPFPHINYKRWREKMCNWAYKIVDHFDFDRELVSIAMNYLDRYLAQSEAEIDTRLFQLLSMTCLYLAIKLNEIKHLVVPGSGMSSSMEAILKLSRGFFTLTQMEKMEMDLLQRLQWNVHPPTPQLFLKYYLMILEFKDSEVQDLAQYMVEVSTIDYFFVSYKPSEVAAAALLDALERQLPYEEIKISSQSPVCSIFHSPHVKVCRERLSLVYAQQSYDLQNDTPSSDESRMKRECHQRMESPTSVMAPP